MVTLILLFVLHVAAIYVGWPMDEQLPNVARIGQTYLFTLASITYRSSVEGSITYTVEDLPTWLSFDSSSRTFSGTPSSSDVESFYISLTGTDSADNSTLSNSYEMLVSNSTGIELSSSDVMFTEIAQYGQTNGQDGLVVLEGELFSVEFSTSVFSLDSDALRPIIAYYGRSADRTSLPNWVKFDADKLSFTGTVPFVTSDIAPSVEYGFSFIASDYYGFAGAEGVFKLVVGAHSLSTLLNETIKINGTFGSDFSYTAPVLSEVYLDGALLNKGNISTVYAADLPSYIRFDETDYSLSGQFPNSSTFDNFTVIVKDVYGNQVDLPYLFDSLGSVFTVKSLPDVNATQGKHFQYQLLKSYFTDINETTIDVTFGNDSSWLSYDSSNLTIAGTAPSDLDLVEVRVDASSNFDDESRSFKIRGVEVASSTSSSSSSSATSSATSTSSTASTSSIPTSDVTLKSSRNSNHKKLVLGLAIGIPALFLILALLLLVFCCARKRKNRDDKEMKRSGSDGELTGPGFGVTHNMDDHLETAHQLGALNALKLDNDNLSTFSSMTHVESDGESKYFDASEKPLKSWRANDASDSNAIKQQFLQQQNRASDASMSTVNTEQLFSVRLVEDASNRGSGQSLANPQFLSNSLNDILRRDTSSGNVQRLDSDGNLAEDGSTSHRPRIPSTSLNKIAEEDRVSNAFYSTANESSNYNLMARFLNDGNASSTNESDAEVPSSHSFNEDFKAVKTPVGNIEWRRSTDRLSPSSEIFLLGQEATPTNNAATADTNYTKNLSKTSVYSNNSDTLSRGDLKTKGGGKAKLVEFTRKGSLRESARRPDVLHPGESAQIHNGDSD